MSIYRFNVRDTLGVIEDEVGMDLPDLTAAYQEAVRSASEYLAEAPPTSGMQFEIRDEAGRVALLVPITTGDLRTSGLH